MGFRHRMYNPNSINLAQVTAGKTVIPISFVEPAATDGDGDAQAYASWLTTGTAATACLLLTADGTENEFVPIVATQSVTQAAVATGFTALDEWVLPDGRIVTEWHRTRSCPP